MKTNSLPKLLCLLSAISLISALRGPAIAQPSIPRHRSDPARIGGFIGNTRIPSAAEEARDRAKFLADLCQHPFRKITLSDGQTRVADLRPLFAWYRAGGTGRSPMPAWKFITITVQNSDQRGLLGLQSASDQHPIHIRNFPRTVPDGTRLRLLAIPSGTHTYTDAYRARHTVTAYDHGQPFTPTPETTTTDTTPGGTSSASPAAQTSKPAFTNTTKFRLPKIRARSAKGSAK